MSEHNCQDGCGGSYKPQRKIPILKAKLPLIIDERLRKNVSFKGILELGTLLNKNAFFFSDDEQYAQEFCNSIKEFPEVRANLVCAINKEATEFSVFACYKGKVTVAQKNYQIDTDILASHKDEKLLEKFCEVEDANNLSFIPVPVISMLILKSISGVQPYDILLAKHYLGQYIKARNDLTTEELDLVYRIKEEGLSTLDDSYNDRVKMFLRIERKLYMQYEH